MSMMSYPENVLGMKKENFGIKEGKWENEEKDY